MKSLLLFILIFISILLSPIIFASEPSYDEHYGELEVSQAPIGKILFSTYINDIGFYYVEYDGEPYYPGHSELLYLHYKHKYYKVLVRPETNTRDKINFINNNLFYFAHYTGGNSINAENRKALIAIENDKIYFCGHFSGYEDIDSDGVKDFYIWEISKAGRDHASHEYEKAKMVFENNILAMPKKP